MGLGLGGFFVCLLFFCLFVGFFVYSCVFCECIFVWFLVLVYGYRMCGFLCIVMGFVGSVCAFSCWFLWDLGVLNVPSSVFMYWGLGVF